MSPLRHVEVGSCLLLVVLAWCSPLFAAESYYYDLQFGNSGVALTKVLRPEGIAIYGSNVYVADRFNHRIQVYNLSGTHQFGLVGTTDELTPSGIDVDTAGDVYVVDGSLGRWARFSGDLSEVRGVYGSDGDGDGELYGPGGICVDEARNRVYIADVNNHRISVWRRDGTFLTDFGSYGTGDSQFRLPRDVAVDSLGRIYVTDAMNDRIKCFNVSYSYLKVFGGSTTGGSNGWAGIMIDGDDRLYATSLINHKVYKYTVNGTLLCAVGGPGTGDGKFDNPPRGGAGQHWQDVRDRLLQRQDPTLQA